MHFGSGASDTDMLPLMNSSYNGMPVQSVYGGGVGSRSNSRGGGGTSLIKSHLANMMKHQNATLERYLTNAVEDSAPQRDMYDSRQLSGNVAQGVNNSYFSQPINQGIIPYRGPQEVQCRSRRDDSPPIKLKSSRKYSRAERDLSKHDKQAVRMHR